MRRRNSFFLSFPKRKGPEWGLFFFSQEAGLNPN